jgi:hypothetical protein
MKAKHQESVTDKPLDLIDTTAVEESLQQADLLRSWARQIRKRRKRTPA